MRKSFKFLTLLLATTLLASCNDNGLPFNPESPEESGIDTPFTNYTAPVSKITFPEEEKSIILNKGETHDYKFTMEPKRAEAKGVAWESDEENIATVSEGKLTAVGGGNTSIRVSSPDDLFSEVELNVEVIVPLVDFSFDVESVNLGYKKTYQIIPVLDPVDSTQAGFTYASSNDNVVEVNDSGIITSKTIDGECDISVTSTALNKTKQLHVKVSEVHASEVRIDKSVSEVEVGKTLGLTAQVLPIEAYEQEIQFTIPETDTQYADMTLTGLITAKKEGIIHVTATNVLLPAIKDTFDVTVYQIRADHIELDDVTLSNKETSYQLIPTYVDDLDQPITPSLVDTHYEVISGSDYVEVDENGLLTYKGKGEATVRISDPQIDPSYSKVINIHCLLKATSVVISGDTNTLYVGQSRTLTITTTPDRSELSDGLAEISLSTETKGAESNFIYISPVNQVTGEVTITALAELVLDDPTKVVTVDFIATVSGTKSNPFKIEIKNMPFDASTVYLVGNRIYESGTSNPIATSWNNSYAALKIDDPISPLPTDATEAFSAEVTFSVGDVWKIRKGDSYKEKESERGRYVMNRMFESNDLYFNSENNVQVNTAGTYKIQYVWYSNNDWYEITATLITASISLDKYAVEVSLHGTYSVNASYYTGELTAVSDDTSVATVSVVGAAIIVTGVASGATFVTVTDSASNEVTFTVEVSSVEMIDIYFTRIADDTYNCWYDTIKVYYWGSNFDSGWPGVDMSHAYRNSSGQEVVKASIPANVTGLIFNCAKVEDGNEYRDQTVDIESGIANNKGFYITGGEWKERTVGSWDVQFYTIAYHANGGAGRMFNDNAVYDASWGLRNNQFEKEGYIFTGWSTNPAATEATFCNNQSVTASDFGVDPGEVVNLYAVWKDPSTTINIYFAKPDSGTYDNAWNGAIKLEFTSSVYEFARHSVDMTYSDGYDSREGYINEYGQMVVHAVIPADATNLVFKGNQYDDIWDNTNMVTTGIKDNAGFNLNGGVWGSRNVGTPWVATFYTLNFRANGGSGDDVAVVRPCVGNYVVPNNEFGFTKASSVVAKWRDTSASVDYEISQLIASGTFADGTTINLDAQWVAAGSTKHIYFTKQMWGSSDFDGKWNQDKKLCIYYWGDANHDPSVTFDNPVEMTKAYDDQYGHEVVMAEIPVDAKGIKFLSQQGDSSYDWTVDITTGIADNKNFYLTTGGEHARECATANVDYYTINYYANNGAAQEPVFSQRAYSEINWGLLNVNSETLHYSKGDNYMFTKWTTNRDGSGTSYLNCALINASPSLTGTTINLYAQWTNSFTLYLDAATNNASHWYRDNARVFVYMYNEANHSFNNTWWGVEMTETSSGSHIYHVSIPVSEFKNYDRFIFLRIYPAGDTIWTRTSADNKIAIYGTDWLTKNCWKIKDDEHNYNYDDGNYTGEWIYHS